jgi:hypothetical protein
MLAGPELETLLFVTDDAEESAGLVDRGLFVDLLGWHLGRVASEGAELHRADEARCDWRHPCGLCEAAALLPTAEHLSVAMPPPLALADLSILV